MQELLDSWIFKNAVAAIVLLTLAWIGSVMIRREYWRLAMRQVFQRKLVVLSFAILCLYAFVAILDSFGYHQALHNVNGVVRVHPDTGKTIRDPDGLSALDLILTSIRTNVEKTYSSPLATHQFQKETMTDESGSTVRAYPRLRYPRRHLFGTDRVGNDVFYQALKSVRTGMIIGLFTTMLVIPFAILFGVTAGFYGKLVDDAIQYVYTVLASIPSILLIGAFMIIVQAKFPDASRLLALCTIMGITSWTGLCRILRGETFKLREMEYVQAAEAMGVSRIRIMSRHIVPNLMHIVLITAVLGFSGRVLAEIILTYVGIGLGAGTMSWGIMINNALRELARSPVIWWNLAAAFLFTFSLVLPANLFGDALRDALDPRLRTE